jgi:hypothetical protein
MEEIAALFIFHWPKGICTGEDFTNKALYKRENLYTEYHYLPPPPSNSR